MAAISTITTTVIGTVLGIASRAVSALCTSTAINKWSKYKPVRGTFPASSNGKYGLNLPTDWTYLQPVDNYRLGDFRGYEHDQANTVPPAYVMHSFSSFEQTSVYDLVRYPDIWGTLKLNTDTTSGITLTDLGLNGYYYGMLISQPAHGISKFKTNAIVAAHNQDFTADMNEGTFPSIVNDGSAINVYFILSSSAIADWTSTPPSTYIVLPTETWNSTSIIGSHAMSIGHWIIPANTEFIEFEATAGSGGYQYNTINSDITVDTFPSGWVIKSAPSWLSLVVWNPITSKVVSTYYNGHQLRAIAGTTNTGPARSGTIVLSDSSSGDSLATVSCSQNAGPVILSVTGGNFSGVTNTGCTGTIGSDTITINFSTLNTGLADREQIWWTATRNAGSNYNSIASEYFIITPQNGSHSKSVHIGDPLIGGETVVIRLYSGGPQI